MTETSQNNEQQQDSLSLRDIIIRVHQWWGYLLRNWILILIFGLLGAGIGLSIALFGKPKYVGELTFVLEDSKSSPFAAYMGLASQLGIDFGGGGNTGVFEGDNIIQFLKSRLMIEKTLLKPIMWSNQEISLADLYVKFNELDKQWAKNPLLKDIHFSINGNRKQFTMQQDSLLDIIQRTIAKKNLEVTRPDKKLSFLSVKCTSINELFSKVFTEQLVKEATEFYIDTKISRSKVNVDKLQKVADSLEQLLNQKTYALAAARDINKNPAREVASVGTEVKTRDKLVLQTMYGEVIKNLELSKMAMSQETPIVQVIDTPILPLKREKLGKLKGLVLGGFIGGILICGFLIIKKIYKEALIR